MKKVFAIFLSILIFGMLMNFPMILADNDIGQVNDSKSSEEVKGTGVITYTEIEGGCWTIVSNDGKTYEPINLDSDFKEQGLTVKFEGTLKSEMVGSSCMVGTLIELSKIEAEDDAPDNETGREGLPGDDFGEEEEDEDRTEKIRAAIKVKNRLRLNSSEIPENCAVTGSVLRCDLEEKFEIKVEVERNIDLSSEAQTTLNELILSINNSKQERIEIEIKIEKDDDEIKIESKVEKGTLNESQQILLDTLIIQLTELIENTEKDVEIEIKIKHRFRKVTTMVIEAGQSGNTIIKIRGFEMETKAELYHHNGELYGVFKGNKTRLINFLPDEIREKIRERIQAQIAENGTIELNEEGEYEVEVRKRSRFLGIFKIKEKIRFHINPETGEILNERAPWWSFLTSDVEEEK